MEQVVYTNEGRILLREGEPEDLSGIMDLNQDREECLFWQEREALKFWFDFQSQFKGRSLVAVLENKIIGHAELLFLPQDDIAYLCYLAVDQDFKRRKFALEMIRYSMTRAKNMGASLYLVYPDSSESIGLYRGLDLDQEATYQRLIIPLNSSSSVDYELEELDYNDRAYQEYSYGMAASVPASYLWEVIFAAQKRDELNFQGVAGIIKGREASALLLWDGMAPSLYFREGDGYQLLSSLLPAIQDYLTKLGGRDQFELSLLSEVLNQWQLQEVVDYSIKGEIYQMVGNY